jgi:two-component system sensor histidine kinase QseC
VLKPSSLRGRLLLLVLGASLAVWLAAAVATWIDARHELDELLDGHLAQAAALLVARQMPELEHEERVDAPVLHRYGPRVTFQVFHEGRLALRSPFAPDTALVGDGTASVSGFHTVKIGDEPWRVFRHPRRGARRPGVRGRTDRIARRDPARGAAQHPAARARGPAPAGAGALVGGGTRRAAAARAGRSAGAAAGRDLRPLQSAGAPDEMRPLLAALDGLFERIGQLLERERRFTGDAAHELRTPIAAIRAQAQVALGASAEPQRRQALERTLAGCDRAARVVEQLLILSRLEAEAPPPRDAVDLAAVAQAVVAELAVTGIARRQAVSFNAGPDAVVAGDATLLAVLCRNLVDNAIRYSPPGARVEVRVRRDAGQVLLIVEDSGPGMADEDLERLGQRFFRAEGTEVRGQRPGLVDRAARRGGPWRHPAGPGLAAAGRPVRGGALRRRRAGRPRCENSPS